MGFDDCFVEFDHIGFVEEVDTESTFGVFVCPFSFGHGLAPFGRSLPYKSVLSNWWRIGKFFKCDDIGVTLFFEDKRDWDIIG